MKTLFLVKTIKDDNYYEDMGAGSVIYIDEVLDNHYCGIWPCGPCTVRVKVKKSNCKRINK